MTGIFDLYVNGKYIKSVESMGEIADDVHYWWNKAKHGDEIRIRCELEV